MLKKLISLLIVAIAFMGFAVRLEAQQPQVNLGNLRVVNALVGVGAVDVFLDGERVAYGLEPEQATPYLFVLAGNHNLTVRPINADELSTPIADVLIDLVPNGSQTAIIYQKQFAVPGENLTSAQSGAVFVIDDDRSPIRLGKTRLTAIHLALGTPQPLTIGYPSGEALLYRLNLEQAYGTIDIDSGAYPLAVMDADSPDNLILQRFGEANFYGNTLYTLIVVPDVAPAVGNALEAVSPDPRMFIISAPLDPPSGDGLRLRIMHTAHDTAVLYIYIDERLVASRVNYGRFTEYLGLANYGHTITIRRFGASLDEPPLGRALFTITPENTTQLNWTLLLVNSNEANTAALQANAAAPGEGVNAPIVFNTPGGAVMVTLLPDNISETQRDFARVRVINAADGVPALRLLTKAFPPPEPVPGVTPTPAPPPTPGPTPTPAPVTEGVVFGAEANEAEIPAGFYEDLTFVPEGSTGVLERIQNVQLVAGVVYTFVLVGSPAGNPPLDLIMLEDYGTGLPIERLYSGVITTASARIRATPSTNGAQVAALTNGTEVEVLGRNRTSEWLRIRFINPLNSARLEGWISATAGIIRVSRLGVPVNVAALPEYTGP